MKNTIKLLCLVLAAAVMLCACSKNADSTDGAFENSSESMLTLEEIIDADNMFTERDTDYSYDGRNPVNITLSDNGSACASENVRIENNTITVSSEGVYVLSGTLSDGQIIIDADDTDKIQLVLNGVNITNSSGAAVYAKNADKVFITSLTDSNSFSIKNDYVQTTDDNVNAVIYSKCNLTMNGSGSLTVNAAYGHGISSKGDLKMAGGNYKITAAKHSLDAKDSVRVTSCTLDLSAQKDGIHSDNDEEADKGYVYIKDGTLNITCGDDAIHAVTALKISGGTIEAAESNEGLEGRIIDISGGNIKINSNDDGLNASSGSAGSEQMNKGAFGGNQTGCSINISGGNLYINAEGDGIDSNGEITVTGGDITVFGSSNDGNSAIDCETSAEISGGTVIALGMSGMAEAFSESSAQCSILYCLENSGKAGDAAELYDSDGNLIVSAKAVKGYNCVIISSPKIVNGEKYILKTDSVSNEIEMNSTVYSNGRDMEKGGMRGMNGKQRPDGNGNNSDEIPDGGNGKKPGDSPGDMENEN